MNKFEEKIPSILTQARKHFGNVRPIHKMELANSRLNEETDKRRPEPMSLMRKREKFLHLEPEGKPLHTLGVIDKAARAIADWDLNDPFAYGRTALHVKQGYLDPQAITKEYTQRTVARRVARAREVERERTTGSVSES